MSAAESIIRVMLELTEVIIILCVASIIGLAFYTQLVEVVKFVAVVTGQRTELAG